LFAGKRIVFIVSTTMFYLTSCIGMLIPTPYMPDNIRFSNFIYMAVLLFVFGIAAGFMLHTVFVKDVVEEAVPPKGPPRPAQRAPQGPTARQAAGAVRSTANPPAKPNS
jgi:hypothetical protein